MSVGIPFWVLKEEEMNMSQTVGYVERATFTGTTGSKEVKVKCDSGAKRTSICKSLGEEIGLGDSVDSVTVKSSNGEQDREVFVVTVQIGDKSEEIEVSVTDRAGMNYDAILGRDVLQDFLLDSGGTFLLSES